MKRLLIDTNVLLDFLLGRNPFGQPAKEILLLAEKDKTLEFTSASAVTDIYYLLEKAIRQSVEDKSEASYLMAQSKIKDLISLVSILPVTSTDILHAIELGWKDFEDAVLYSVALANDIDFIISRDKGFIGSDIPVISPEEFLAGKQTKEES